MFKLTYQNKNFLLVNLCIGIEYYNFIIYSVMAYYLEQLFFVSSSTNIISALIIFSTGYTVRPFAGFILGIMGDKLGRRPILIFITLLSIVAAIGITILPTYNDIGIKATISLLIFRIIQSFAFSAELPGVAIFISEHLIKEKHGFYYGILMVPIAIGSILASTIPFFILKLIGIEQMLQYGWKLPFIFGAILALFSLKLRTLLNESPEFIRLTNKGKNTITLLEILSNLQWYKIFISILISLPGIFLVILCLYLPSYLVKYFQCEIANMHLATCIGTVIAAALSPILGSIADIIGIKKIRTLHLMIVPLLITVLIGMLNIYPIVIAMVVLIICQIASYTSYISILSTLNSLFPTYARYSSVSLGYNASCCLAGFTPVLMNFIIEKSQYTSSINLVIIAVYFLAILATNYLKQYDFTNN